MDQSPELQRNGHWLIAVWALRAGYISLAVVLTGLIVVTIGSTPWVLAVGMFLWLSVAVVTLTEVLWARSQIPEPRPGLWPIRFMLIHDTVHARSSAPHS
jgi:hypothetical protein